MSDVNGMAVHIPRHIAALLDQSQRRYREVMNELIPGVLDSLTDPGLREIAGRLRGSHFRMLSVIPPDGARVTDIAEYASMTKQSAGESLGYLGSEGLIEIVADPTDRRARLTRRTALGDEMVTMANDLVAKVEKRWRRKIGADDYDAMRRALVRIATEEL
ncbi:MarR family transcriptional regulator [Jatrophihabitans sp. DSM 45814]